MTEVKAYAKINLFLDVTGKREDGYHDIKSYMQTVEYYDTISLEVCDSENISVIGMPEIEETKNLAYKAAAAFFEKTGIPAGLKIFIDKRIPSEAGLGGGSSDAAAVIRGLNEIFETNLTNEELIEIAKKVGSDVPFLVFKIALNSAWQTYKYLLSKPSPLFHVNSSSSNLDGMPL